MPHRFLKSSFNFSTTDIRCNEYSFYFFMSRMRLTSLWTTEGLELYSRCDSKRTTLRSHGLACERKLKTPLISETGPSVVYFLYFVQLLKSQKYVEMGDGHWMFEQKFTNFSLLWDEPPLLGPLTIFSSQASTSFTLVLSYKRDRKI